MQWNIGVKSLQIWVTKLWKHNIETPTQPDFIVDFFHDVNRCEGNFKVDWPFSQDQVKFICIVLFTNTPSFKAALLFIML